ncbi:hypothetical protein [Spirulina sp. 06S082]|uniref:hypothetical protein n=1 Tax=Spirulina sp. 06S082 TaxID=3110248 RepID=UPI002B217751|nr:hypothetical protein [Spirulina sp. 06S082]MEA5467475.1 hypothetical protein [Spirulina sp. 06S082]
MVTLQARQLNLEEVEDLLGFQVRYDGSFTSFLTLEPITDTERQELIKIRDDFHPYLKRQALEGQIRLIAVTPILRLAGFYHPSIQIEVETNIAPINIDLDDMQITGRLDILAVSSQQKTPTNTDLWILVIETKKVQASMVVGLPQLLVYAYKSLEHQESVWGVVTNGSEYQFVYVQRGSPPTYLRMPFLNIFDRSSAQQLLQVFKALAGCISS